MPDFGSRGGGSGTRLPGKPPTSYGWAKQGGKTGLLKTFILDDDWTFVTRNSVDFRGASSSPGSTGQFADVPLHAGLICINGPDGMTAEVQCELFRAALDEIGDTGQFVNEVIEVDLESLEADATIHRYALPEEFN